MEASNHSRPGSSVQYRADGPVLSAGGRADAMERLVERADELALRAPELTMVLGERAAAIAEATGSGPWWVRAESAVVSARVRLGLRPTTVGRAVAALRAAEDAGYHEIAARLRTDLVVCARSVGAPLLGLAALRPVLADSDLPGELRATALCHLVGCMADLGRKSELDRVLVEADRICSADDGRDADTRVLQRALLKVGTSAHRRRHGDLTAAADAARTGLGMLDRLERPEGDAGLVRVRLVLQLVCTLLDRGDGELAFELAEPVLAAPVRAAAVAPVGWLRLAVATRIHQPAGQGDAAIRLLRDAVHDADRHGLHALTSRLWLELAHVEEKFGGPSEAIECLHRSRAAEHVHARARRQACGLLAGEFGAGEQPPVELDDVLAPAPRRGTGTPSLVRVPEPSRSVQPPEPARWEAPAPRAADSSERDRPAMREPQPSSPSSPWARPAEPEPGHFDQETRRFWARPESDAESHPASPGSEDTRSGGKEQRAAVSRADGPPEPPRREITPTREELPAERPRWDLPTAGAAQRPSWEPGRPERTPDTDGRNTVTQGEGRRSATESSLLGELPVEPAKTWVPAPIVEPGPAPAIRADDRRPPRLDPPAWAAEPGRRPEPPSHQAPTTRHDAEHGSEAARSVLDRLGIPASGGGGRRRATGATDPVLGPPGRAESTGHVPPDVALPPADLLGPPARDELEGDRRESDGRVEAAGRVATGGDSVDHGATADRRDTGGRDGTGERREAGERRDEVAGPWLPRLRLPPSLEPVGDFADEWPSGTGSGDTPPAATGTLPHDSPSYDAVPELGEPFPAGYADAIASDEPPPDAGLADLLARALAEHQAGTASAAALVKRIGARRDLSGPRPRNGHRMTDSAEQGRRKTGD